MPRLKQHFDWCRRVETVETYARRPFGAVFNKTITLRQEPIVVNQAKFFSLTSYPRLEETSRKIEDLPEPKLSRDIEYLLEEETEKFLRLQQGIFKDGCSHAIS